MAITVKDLSTTGTQIPYAFKEDWPKKWLKKAIFIQKNDPFDQKIGYMYLDGFYGFPNFRPKT